MSLKGPRNGSTNCIADSWRLLKGLFLCLGVLATRNRVYKRFEVHLICYLVFLKLSLDIFLYLLFVPPYCVCVSVAGLDTSGWPI